MEWLCGSATRGAKAGARGQNNVGVFTLRVFAYSSKDGGLREKWRAYSSTNRLPDGNILFCI